jgi:hypothetical protein
MISEFELWNRIEQLEGRTIQTTTARYPRLIKTVSDSRLIIEGRSKPISRNHIARAYKSLNDDGELRVGMTKHWLWQIVPPIIHAAIPDETELILETPNGIRIKAQ